MSSIEALIRAAAFLDRSDDDADRVSFVCDLSADRRLLMHNIVVSNNNNNDGFSNSSYETAEHGYATTLPMPHHHHHHHHQRDQKNSFANSVLTVGKRSKTRKNSVGRSNHNELEKNRRAHLKNCLDALKDMVPLGPEASRHTTLGLLTKAKKFIKNLEERERRNNAYKDHLNREQRYLKLKLEQLQHFQSISSKRRSVSECSSSSSTVSSSHSTVSQSSSIPSPVSESDEVDIMGYGSSSGAQSSDSDEGGSFSIRSSLSSSSGGRSSASTTCSATLSLRLSEMEAL